MFLYLEYFQVPKEPQIGSPILEQLVQTILTYLQKGDKLQEYDPFVSPG